MVCSNFSLRELLSGFRRQSLSMRRRFVLCLITVLVLIVAVLLTLFSLFDVTNSANDELEQLLNQQLNYSANQMYRDMDKLAVCAVEFSHQMSAQLEDFGTPFDRLKNNVEALTALQSKTYETVFNNMRIADCRGAFFILNTTVNDSLGESYYSGLYLRYANVGSDITLRNSVCIFRGASKVARQQGINLFSTWECEMKAGTFPQMEAVLHQPESDPARGYLLTKSYKLPDAWEKVRLLCAPISDGSGQIIGVCGFELSDPFFRSSYQASDAEQPFLISAMIEQEGSVYTGQFAANHSGYAPNLQGQLSVTRKDGFEIFSDANMTLIGKMQTLRVGQSEHTVAVMLPETQYEQLVSSTMRKTTLLLVVVSVLAIALSVMISHRYIRPILKTVEQLKTGRFEDDGRVSEFSDLFEYLAEQDRINEEALDRLRREKADAVTAASELQCKFDATARQNERLAYSRKEEIDPYDYDNFKNGLKMLTGKEREIFDYYLQGKTVKEIIAITGLQESTVRFHNKNIYSKLGVHSLKQLLRYAAIAAQEEPEARPS